MTCPEPSGRRDRPGVPDESTRVGDRVQSACGLRRHPVPADLPVASVLLDEATLVLVAESLPQLRSDRPKTVDRRAPVAGLLDSPLDVRVDDALQLVERADPGDARRWRHQRGGRHPVRRGHEVVPRDGVQRPPRTIRRDRDVDHGESGADEQEVTVGQLVGPRVCDIGTAEPCRRPVGARRGPGGEHDGAGDDRLPRGEAHREAVTASGDPDHGFQSAFEAGVAGELRRGLQQAADVVAVHPPWDEVLRLRLRVVVVAHPAEEVLGIPRESAHPTGGNVEQVPFVRRRVRRPAARRRGGVDERDPVPRREARHQVGGRQRSRRTGPDHDDTAVALASTHLAPAFESLVIRCTKLSKGSGNASIDARGVATGLVQGRGTALDVRTGCPRPDSLAARVAATVGGVPDVGVPRHASP